MIYLCFRFEYKLFKVKKFHLKQNRRGEDEIILSLLSFNKRDNDLRENPEFMELRVKAMHTLPSQKEKILWRIKEAVIIEETPEYQNFDGSIVIVGSIVTFIMDGIEERFTILGSGEGDFDNDTIAYDAPLAQAILGKKLGDVVTFNSRTIVIKKIERI